MVHKKYSERSILLIALLVLVISAVQSYLMYNETHGADPYIQLKSILISSASSFYMVAGFGLAGFFAARRLDFAEVIGDKVSWKTRFALPAMVGVSLACLFIAVDYFFNPGSPLRELWQPELHISLLIGLTTSTLEATFFVLFLVPLITWFFFTLLFRKHFFKLSFLIATFLSVALFMFLHVPNFIALSEMELAGGLQQQLLYQIIVMNMLLSTASALFLYRGGFLSVLLLHYSMDIVWTLFYLM